MRVIHFHQICFAWIITSWKSFIFAIHLCPFPFFALSFIGPQSCLFLVATEQNEIVDYRKCFNIPFDHSGRNVNMNILEKRLCQVGKLRIHRQLHRCGLCVRLLIHNMIRDLLSSFSSVMISADFLFFLLLYSKIWKIIIIQCRHINICFVCKLRSWLIMRKMFVIFI